MDTTIEVGASVSLRSRIQHWLFRVFFSCASILLAVSITVLNSALTQPEVQESSMDTLYFLVHLFVVLFMIALAFCNFTNTLLRSSQMLMLTGALILVPELLIALTVFLVKGIPANFNMQVKTWYVESISALFIVVGFLINRLDHSTQKSSQQNALDAFDPSLSEQPPPSTSGTLWLRRVGACLLDYSTFGMIAWVIGMLLGEKEATSTASGLVVQAHESNLSLLLTIWVWPLYFIGIESLWGKSPGHFILGLKLFQEHRRDRMLKVSILRHSCDILEILPFGIPALVLVILRRDGKRLGDIVGGCRVISTW